LPDLVVIGLSVDAALEDPLKWMDAVIQQFENDNPEGE